MTNWIRNEVTIWCDHPGILKVIEAIFTSPNPFKTFVPRRELIDYTGTYRKEVLIEGWNIRNWGTKWDIDPQEPDRLEDDTLFYCFDTASSPPVGIHDAICRILGKHGHVRWFYRDDGARTTGWIGKDI